MVNKGFPTSFIDELKSKCDIVSTLSKYVTMQKKGKHYWACCPFHYEKTPSFAVNEPEQFYHCYGCGESGDVIKFVQKYENVGFMEALKILADSCGMKLPELEQSTQDLELLKNKEKCLKALNLAMDYYHQNLKSDKAAMANNYLQKRGIDRQVCEDFSIGCSSDWNSIIDYLSKQGVSLSTMQMAGLVEKSESGKYYDVFGTRLMFPIRNSYCDCIGFTARTLEADSKFAKYKNSPQTIVFDKSKTIYNINTIKALKKQNLDYIIICEGTIDVIAMYKAGFKNTVACMGTAITNYHARELKRYCDKIILCLDGDSAGQNAMYKAIDVLDAEGLEVKVAKLSENLDPDEFLKKYGADKLKDCLEKSIDGFEFKLTSLATRFDLSDSYQKNKYVLQALEIVSDMDSSSQREIYLKIISKLVNISIDVLRRDIARSKAQDVSSLPKEQIDDKVFIVREEGLLKAVKFVLASIIHKMDYAKDALKLGLTFKNPSYQSLYDFAVRCENENKTYTISSLFDYFDVDNNQDVKQVIDFNFSSYAGGEAIYFKECLDKMLLITLKKQQEELTNNFKKELDLDKRREIANKLIQITKEIKNKTEKKSNV